MRGRQRYNKYFNWIFYLSCAAMLKQIHIWLKSKILSIIDFFYPLVRSIIPLQTFRYAVCGVGNLALNIVMYFVFFNFVLQKQILHFGPLTFTAHIGAFVLAFLITFPIGFYLSLFVVFPGSALKRRIQLFRYLLVTAACFLLNYLFLKLFVEVFHWYPTLSQIANTIFVTTFSYFSQRHFSFKQKEIED